MILLLIIFIVGILLLLKCADVFVDGASNLAKRFGVSTIVIGFTVVAFGTSLPELVVSMGAALSGSSDLALGNVIGSNVANIGLVLGICSLLAPQIWGGKDKKKPILELTLMLAATAIFILLALNGMFSRVEGVMLLLLFAIALFIIWKSVKTEEASKPDDDTQSKPARFEYHDVWMTILGFAGVIIGAQMVVSSAEEIARMFGVSEFIIGVTIVAVGTSLPELVTSVVAILKKEFAISAGNILGSNLFNCFMVIGASASILPIIVQNLNDLVLLAIFTVAVLPLLTARTIITRTWGGVLLIGYVGYILYYAGVLTL